jgi:hypothetical protein
MRMEYDEKVMERGTVVDAEEIRDNVMRREYNEKRWKVKLSVT